MRRHPLNNVLDRIRTKACQSDEAVLTDGQLLERYLAAKDEEAFAALVNRHGPMVFAVCRRMIANRQDAEDAFQATFLVLVRKAASIRPRDMVGNWLYGVAFRAALKARTVAGRQVAREKPMKYAPEPATIEAGLWEDLLPLLDQELNSLPDKFRLPIVLCDLEGLTRKDAARRLGWPEGTVAGRIAQARSLLAKRLARKGLPVTAGVLAALMAQNAASAAVPAALVSSTIPLTSADAAASGALSAKVAALAEGVLKAMLVSKLTSAAFIIAVLAFLALGSSVLVIGQTDAAGDARPMAALIDEHKVGARKNHGNEFEDINAGAVNFQRNKAFDVANVPLPRFDPTPKVPAGYWWYKGNGFEGELVINVGADGKVTGSIHGDKVVGLFEPKASTLTFRRVVISGPKEVEVQEYTATFAEGPPVQRGNEAKRFILRGTAKSLNGAFWGAAGVLYPWEATVYCERLPKMSINQIMKAAHLTPGNRGTKKNLDSKVIDGGATHAEQVQLLDLYEELERRDPPVGDKKAWKERTSEMVAALKAVMAGENQASQRLLKARDCKACHDVHRRAAVNLPKADLVKIGAGYVPGDKMHRMVVDFVAGQRTGGAGCPSVMIGNSGTPGIILWSRSSEARVFELAAGLQPLVDGRKSQGYLVIFNDQTKKSLLESADFHGLETFQVGTPRHLKDERPFFELGAGQDAELVVFVVDSHTIRGAWALAPGSLSAERMATIIADVSYVLKSDKR